MPGQEPRRTPELKVKFATVPTATYYQIEDENLYRNHFMINYEPGFDYFVAYQNTKPTSTNQMTKLETNYLGDFLDAGVVPTSKIWVYHTQGSDQIIKWREA